MVGYICVSCKKLFLGGGSFSPEGPGRGAERILIVFLLQKLPTVQKLGRTLYIFQIAYVVWFAFIEL